jgi:hypothetical protein
MWDHRTASLLGTFRWIFLKSSNKLLKPGVADAKLPSPVSTGRPFTAGGVPLECESPDHA